MSGFVPSAPNPDDQFGSGGVPIPPAGGATPPPAGGGFAPPPDGVAQPPVPQQPFSGGGDDWGGAATPPGGSGNDDGGRRVSPLVIVLLAILGVALIGLGAYTFLGRSGDSGPTPAPSPTQTAPTPPALKPVPNVVGFSVEEATASLQGSGFTVGTVTDQPSDIAPGKVTAQDPASGVEVPAGTVVNIVVSVPQTPGVPDVEGLSKTDATNTLIAAGFEIGKVTEKNSAKPKGTVLDQSPTAGKKAKPGAKVNLVVSTGLVKVPDVVGKKEKRAIADLENAGFKVEVQDARNGEVGRVKGQSPKAGAMKERGTVIVISVVPKVL